MLYLLFVLTFLCGILFYGMSPHDKQMDMTVHQAEGMIVSFVSQHQAAKNYVDYWLGVGEDDGDKSGNIQSSVSTSGIDANLKENFEDFIPKSATSDMCDGNSGVPGVSGCKNGDNQIAGFISRVVCTVDGIQAADCNASNAKRYLISYGGWAGIEDGDFIRPSWWPRPGTRMRRYEAWRKAISHLTRGSVSCGTLFKTDDGNWCIDNGTTVYKNESAATKECVTIVPDAVISSVDTSLVGYGDAMKESYKYDLLFCMSKFNQGVGSNRYDSPDYFYDGVSNIGVGQHQTGQTGGVTKWQNLGTTGGTLSWTNQTSSPVIDGKWIDDNPYLSLHGFLKTGIQLGSNYTLTILMSGYGDSPLSCGLLQTIDTETTELFDLNVYTIFKKLGASERLDGTDAVQLTTPSENKTTSICNMNGSGNSTGVVSWTFVVKNGTILDVYENATRRFTNETIQNTTGKYLVLGNGSTEVGDVPHIYSIRYYSGILTDTLIRQNFKLDQKRFGIMDINNAEARVSCVNQDNIKNSAGG